MTVRNRIVTSAAVAAILCLLLFLPCLSCAAQTTVVDVVDKSTVNCAVRLSGTIEFTESEVQGENHTSFASHVSATNFSKVPIVAMVTYTTIGNSMGSLVGENHLLDAFFKHDLEIAPGQTSTHKHDDNGKFILRFLREMSRSPLLVAAKSYSFSSRMALPAGTPMMDASKASWIRERTCS